VFWIDVVLSLLLPFLAFGVVGLIARLIMATVAVKPEALARAQSVEAARSRSPAHQADQSRKSWESVFDSEMQRIRRRNLNH
jgi:hypothetical protein